MPNPYPFADIEDVYWACLGDIYALQELEKFPAIKSQVEYLHSSLKCALPMRDQYPELLILLFETREKLGREDFTAMIFGALFALRSAERDVRQRMKEDVLMYIKQKCNG